MPPPICDARSSTSGKSVDWNNVADGEHMVQFYDRESTLIETISEYVIAGLNRGERALVIATQAHLHALDDAVRARGMNLTACRRQGDYLALNAAETLSSFMVNGMPDPNRFFKVVGGLAQNASTGRRPVRAFGEMVAILWVEGNLAAAIELEALWNQLLDRYPFRLLCAYPMARFRRESSRESFQQICRHHTRLIPTG